MTPDPDLIWKRMAAELRRRLPGTTFDLWIAPLRCRSFDGSALVLEGPPEVCAWVRQRCLPLLRATAAETLEAAVDVQLADVGGAAPPPSPGHAPASAGGDAPAAPPSDRLNPKFTFEQFVIGDANRFAHAAALSVAELPSQAYNPLFLVGPPGVGKTHLLHSIGNYVRAYGGGLTVRYATVESFTNEFLAALQSKESHEVGAFKRRFRHTDVLLIDDVQFLESKVKTQEEFFHTFNALHAAGSQLVLTSDRPPRDMAKMAERLRERFESGLLVDLGCPDLPTRLTVLRKRVLHDQIALSDEGVLDLIAERVTTNIRALEGALIRVVAYASLTDAPITLELAERVLGDLYSSQDRRPRRAGQPARTTPGTHGSSPGPSIPEIQEAVAEAFGLTVTELVSRSRAARIAWPRQVAMYLAREHTAESLPAIGAQFGGRDHSTVLHACKKAKSRLASDPEASDAVRLLTDRLAGPAASTRFDRSP